MAFGGKREGLGAKKNGGGGGQIIQYLTTANFQTATFTVTGTREQQYFKTRK